MLAVTRLTSEPPAIPGERHGDDVRAVPRWVVPVYRGVAFAAWALWAVSFFMPAMVARYELIPGKLSDPDYTPGWQAMVLSLQVLITGAFPYGIPGLTNLGMLLSPLAVFSRNSRRHAIFRGFAWGATAWNATVPITISLPGSRFTYGFWAWRCRSASC